MTKRVRPHIPLPVRVEVAHRQIMTLNISGALQVANALLVDSTSIKYQLAVMLGILFPDQKCELHHRPALINRKFNKKTGRYSPDANDPEYLVYLEKNDHRIETHVRGTGAQYSDMALRKRERRRNRKAKRKSLWKGRPFPKGRKLQSKGFMS